MSSLRSCAPLGSGTVASMSEYGGIGGAEHHGGVPTPGQGFSAAQGRSDALRGELADERRPARRHWWQVGRRRAHRSPGPPRARPPRAGQPLTSREREFLAAGLLEWGGPAHPTDALAVAMGFENEADLHLESERIRQALRGGRSLTPLDWTRALIATEVCFASDYFGAGVEWSIVTQFEDEESVRLLRSVQRKLVSYRSAMDERGTKRVDSRDWQRLSTEGRLACRTTIRSGLIVGL